MNHHNDNADHVILEEDRAGNVRPVLAPLPVGADAWEQFRRAVESGSVRDEVAALHDLHAAIFGRAA